MCMHSEWACSPWFITAPPARVPGLMLTSGPVLAMASSRRTGVRPESQTGGDPIAPAPSFLTTQTKVPSMPNHLLRHLFVILVAILGSRSADAAEVSIPGVYAANGTIFITGTLAAGNQVAVNLDSSGVYVIVSMNSQSVAYDADGVTTVVYTSGVGGGDTASFGQLYSNQNLQINLVTGNNQVSIGTGAGETVPVLITSYGDHNALTSTNSTFVSVTPYGGSHNTYSVLSFFHINNVTAIPYITSSIPGVCLIDDEIVIFPNLSLGNQVTVGVGSGSSTVSVSENGQSSNFGSIIPSTLLYSGGQGGGDVLNVSLPVNVDGSFFGGSNTYTGGNGQLVLFMLYGSGDIFTLGSTSRGQVTEVSGLTALTETLNGTFVELTTVTPPMAGIAPPTGSTTTGSTTTGTSSTTSGSSTSGTSSTGTSASGSTSGSTSGTGTSTTAASGSASASASAGAATSSGANTAVPSSGSASSGCGLGTSLGAITACLLLVGVSRRSRRHP
jgi:hypothetical protein